MTLFEPAQFQETIQCAITLTAEVSDSLPAQKGEVTVRAGFHGAPREVAICLAMGLAVQNVSA